MVDPNKHPFFDEELQEPLSAGAVVRSVVENLKQGQHVADGERVSPRSVNDMYTRIDDLQETYDMAVTDGQVERANSLRQQLDGSRAELRRLQEELLPNKDTKPQ